MVDDGAAKKAVVGTLRVPGDKSVTHRALLLGALAHGTTRVHGPLCAEDTRTTVRALRALGVCVAGAPADAAVVTAADDDDDGAAVWTVTGLGATPFTDVAPDEPPATVDCGNSGTTLRLLTGLLAGRGGRATLVGDASLSRRPMARLVAPLRALGAEVYCGQNGRPPVVVGKTPAGEYAAKTNLRGAEVVLDVASAQVKSAVLLAALGARGTTTVRGRTYSRDHTERMLHQFGVTLEAKEDGTLVLRGPQALHATDVVVPGDPSAAAFFWAAAAMLPGSALVTPNVSLNPTRTGLLRVLARMGAQLRVVPDNAGGGEPRGTVYVRGGPLVGCVVDGDEVPALIDELPLLCVLAQAAQGRTTLRGAAELRHKESDRLAAMAHNLQALGGSMREVQDGFDADGGRPLCGAQLQSFGDHRVAMACAVAALLARGPSTVHGRACVAVSYPNFFAAMQRLTGGCAPPQES